MGNIEQAVQWMIDIANDNTHGYDQAYRNGPDYDCSSLVGTALNRAGFNVNPSSTTYNLRSQLLAEGFIELPLSAPRERGDIFLSTKNHVVACISPTHIVHASINELGKVRGGQTGDQTGKEICTRTFYTPSYGWNYHFRYIGEGGVNPGYGNAINLTQTITRRKRLRRQGIKNFKEWGLY